MNRATRIRIVAAAVLAASLLAGACSGASDPTPRPTIVDVVDDAANEPNTGFGAAVDRANDVAGDLEARNDALDN